MLLIKKDIVQSKILTSFQTPVFELIMGGSKDILQLFQSSR